MSTTGRIGWRQVVKVGSLRPLFRATVLILIAVEIRAELDRPTLSPLWPPVIDLVVRGWPGRFMILWTLAGFALLIGAVGMGLSWAGRPGQHRPLVLPRCPWFPRIDRLTAVIVGLFLVSHVVPAFPDLPHGPARGWAIPCAAIRNLHEDLEYLPAPPGAPAGVAPLLRVLPLVQRRDLRVDVLLSLPILLAPLGIAASLARSQGRRQVAGAVAAVAGLGALACGVGALVDLTRPGPPFLSRPGFLPQLFTLPGCHLWAASMILLVVAGMRQVYPRAVSLPAHAGKGHRAEESGPARWTECR